MTPLQASLRVLFPEAGHPGASDTVLHGADAEQRAAYLSRDGRRVWVVAPGVLRTPPFQEAPPWISGMVATLWHDGVAEPGGIAEPMIDASEAASLAARLVNGRLGGDFWAPSPGPEALRPGRVLVQAGRGGAADRQRLGAAVGSYGAACVVLLLPGLHRPLAERASSLGCAVVVGAVDPWPLLDGARAVHAAGGEPLATLAQLAGLPGQSVPGEAPQSRASEILSARYADPFTGRRIGCAAALDIVAEWRRVTRANRAVGACTGMSFWKRRRMQAFLHDGQRAPAHRASAAAALEQAAGRAVAAWSSRIPAGLQSSGRLLRVEDGFVRSVGLGSGFLPPCSVIVDRAGIYYDPSRPSDLEVILRDTVFEPALLARARGIMTRMVQEGVTKYGASSAPVLLPDAAGRTRVLVPGQVADDLSVRLGGAGVAGNEELLARVRAGNPDAYVIYKPHPDVDAGHRVGVVPDATARRYADLVLRGTPMATTIAAVDEVHTLTSLAGYEALLRGRRVVVHGQPFYAGWGLTEDLAPLPRRGRPLSLEELSAGLLLMYARYIDPVTGLICPAEVLLDRLADPAAWAETPLMRARRLQGRLRAWFASGR